MFYAVMELLYTCFLSLKLGGLDNVATSESWVGMTQK